MKYKDNGSTKYCEEIYESKSKNKDGHQQRKIYLLRGLSVIVLEKKFTN